MFTAFDTMPSEPSRQNQNNTSSLMPSPTTPVRAKRNQVARACQWCRVHRIKCDNNYPCYNCQNRGGECSNKGTNEVRTLPGAVREIEHLRQRVKELEAQLETSNHSVTNASSRGSPLVQPNTSESVDLDPFEEHGGRKKHWEGIHTSTTQSLQTQCYGPASSFYFIGRMTSYLRAALQQPCSDHHLQPNSASKSFACLSSPRRNNAENNQSLLPMDTPTASENLTEMQEDYFLGSFWQSYHCVYQILDETEFKKHYRSLWTEPGVPRKPSALVDIVIGICLQYGVAFMPRNTLSKADVDGNDATIAGRGFYRRSQSLLDAELESPSITTLQTQIFVVVYLCNASFQNMAHSALALAIRIAQILGLHLEPPEGMPRAQRELRKRVWWTLYTVEIKTSMKLGRPWSVQLSQVTCSLPMDDHELAVLSGSNFASFNKEVTWLTFCIQNTKLVLAARAVYTAFYNKCNGVIAANEGKSIYSDSQSAESCAGFLLSSMKCLRTWLQGVPDALRTKRKGTGEPFSTDRSALDIDIFAPLWLQRQRLLLELLYHNLAMNLYRPFVCFSSRFRSDTPLAEGLSISCVNHAITLTNILHQVLTETDILGGWYEAYQWQWNAALSMIGFILAYPVTPSTPSARKAIGNAIEVFEIFGNSFAVAASASNVTRHLTAKADFLIDRFRTGLTTVTSPSISTAANTMQLQSFDSPQPSNGEPGGSAIVSQLGEDGSSIFQHDDLADTLGLAFTIDSFNSFEPLWAANNSNMPDMWNFTQD